MTRPRGADAASPARAAAAALRDASRAAKGERAFALISVLLVTAVLSAGALATAIVVRAGGRGSAVEAQAIAARALADAGLTRAIAALEDDGDPLRQRLMASPNGVAWRHGDEVVRITLVREAGKVDLNRGRADLVTAVMRGIVPDRAVSEPLLERLAALRRTGRELESVPALLDARERFGSLAQTLEAAFTVLSSAEGVDPLAAPDAVLRHVPGLTEPDHMMLDEARRGDADPAAVGRLKTRLGVLLAGERPLYRIAAETRAGETKLRREAIVAQNVTTRRVRVVAW